MSETNSRQQEPEVNKLLRMANKYEAHDLCLIVGHPPMVRLRGDLHRTQMPPLSQADMERLLSPVLKPHDRKILDEVGSVSLDWTVGNDECRFRVSLVKQPSDSTIEWHCTCFRHR